EVDVSSRWGDVSVSAKKTVRVWSGQLGEMMNVFRVSGHQEEVNSAEFSRDGTVVSGSIG
ncbi:hypothetical protein PAXRUDRAFT_168773, partial [Paxillus rubicundulus Ve08.2h10]